ncbi:MAG: hypothetical protein ACI8SR_001437 [Oceanicoccus sp.]|jgi:hypothetical protein
MFKNKHVVVSLIVAPILAIISYFAIDSIVSETPHAAKPGERVALIEKSNCRYPSGRCDLKNGEFEVHVEAKWTSDVQVSLTLESKYPLDGIIAAHVSDKAENMPPINMRQLDDTGMKWSLNLINPNLKIDRLQLATSANRTLYYGDASLAFINYETSYDEDFRK